MRVHALRISRFQPGATQTPDSAWTSIGDVGQTFSEGVLTLAEYERVEALYLNAVSLLLEDSEVRQLIVSDVQLTPLASETARAIREGALVSASDALEICRLELRDEVSCRLEDDGRFYVHIGFDYYLYVGSKQVSAAAIEAIEQSGLFVEQGIPSPYTTAD